MMMPEEITALVSTVAVTFYTIAGQPTKSDLTMICNVLYPLILRFPHDKDGTHNLIRIIEPTTSYTLHGVPPSRTDNLRN